MRPDYGMVLHNLPCRICDKTPMITGTYNETYFLQHKCDSTNIELEFETLEEVIRQWNLYYR